MRPILSEKSIAALREVKAAILEEPKHFEMRSWVGTDYCGTTACIAGHACMIKLGIPNWRENLNACVSYPGAMGKEFLGLDDNQARRLFFIRWMHNSPWGWPEECADKYRRALLDGNKQKAAQIAADRIELFIKSGGTV